VEVGQKLPGGTDKNCQKHHNNKRSNQNSNRQLIKRKGKFVPLHPLKAYAGGRSTYPLILTLGASEAALSTSNPDRLNPHQKPRYMWVPERIWTVWET